MKCCVKGCRAEASKADLEASNVASEARSRPSGSLATAAAALAQLGCMAKSIDQGRLAAVGDPCRYSICLPGP